MTDKSRRKGSLREYIASTLATMKTDMSRIENVISNFERRIDAIMNKIDDLEQRVSYLEKLLGVNRIKER
ncbi:MAG: hypothetical protein J7J20_05400 [Desulfurococcales archaeon]|nr:hypothetical protein [Desulfurococcales archaeon]